MAFAPTQTPRRITAPESDAPVQATAYPFAVDATPADLPPATLDPALLTQVAGQGQSQGPHDDMLVAAGELSAAPSITAETLLIGHSTEGRVLEAWRFGRGDHALLLVGGIHGGWEGNTVTLMNELAAHFAANPGDILPQISLLVLPVANPDGLVHGRTPEGRFNASGVDLNRNWACGWQAEAYWRSQTVDAGQRAFSEPETRALGAFIREVRPAVVLFYHSAAAGVFAGQCEGDHGSAAMSAVLGEATGYSYGSAFSAYPVTGTAASWVDGQGIPSADVELASWRDSEFERNLRGVMAVQAWVVSQN